MADSMASATAASPLPAQPATPEVAGAGAVAAQRGLPVEATPSPPRAPPRGKAAGAMEALRGLLPDAGPLTFVGAMWANQAASGVAVAARWACGEDSRAAALAKEASYAAFVAMGLLVPLAYRRMIWKLDGAHAHAREGRRLQPACIGLDRDGRFTPAPLLIILFCCALMLVSMLIQGREPAEGSWLEKVGSGLSDLGTFLASVTLCSVILPNLVIVLLRASPR